MIELKNITKRYGNYTALHNISLNIDGEEFVCIIGPTGAGKSTLLHLLIGADKPDQGEITLDHFEVTAMNSHELATYRQKIGILFQDHKLLPKKTVFENVALPLEMTHHHEAYIHARVIEVLHLVGLVGKEKKFPHELSAGEKQKVALARAMVGSPLLLIADEPTGHLDPDATNELIKLLVKINKNGTTVILATHHKDLVNQVHGRVVKMQEGKIVSDQRQGSYC